MGATVSRGMVLGVGLAIDVGIQLVGWATACLFKTEKAYDALGTVSFLALALGSLGCSVSQYPRQIVMSTLVSAWTLRLGSFLLLRVLKTGGDSRFDELKHKPRKPGALRPPLACLRNAHLVVQNPLAWLLA